MQTEIKNFSAPGCNVCLLSINKIVIIIPTDIICRQTDRPTKKPVKEKFMLSVLIVMPKQFLCFSTDLLLIKSQDILRVLPKKPKLSLFQWFVQRFGINTFFITVLFHYYFTFFLLHP